MIKAGGVHAAYPASLSVGAVLSGIKLDPVRMQIRVPVEGQETGADLTSLPAEDAEQWARDFGTQALVEQGDMRRELRCAQSWQLLNPKYSLFNMSEIISAASKPPEEGRIPIWLVEVYKGQGLSVKMAHRQHTHIAFADGGVGVEMEITSEGARVINTFLTVSEEALIAFVRGSGLFTSILPAWFYHSHPDYLMRSAVTLIMHEEVLEQPELELDAPYLRSYRSRDEDDGMGYSFGNGVGLYDEEHGLEYWAPSITCYGYHGMFDTDTAAVFVHRSSMAGETYYQIKIGDIDPTVKEMMLSGRNVDLVQAALTLGRPRLSSNPPARF